MPAHKESLSVINDTHGKHMACVHVSPRLVVAASLAASPRLDFGVSP